MNHKGKPTPLTTNEELEELRNTMAAVIKAHGLHHLSFYEQLLNELFHEVTVVFDQQTKEAEEKAVVAYRDKASTDGRPLNAEPLVVKMPVPCPGCGAEEYYDWYLYPHQVYNHFMPGGVGHYCFPCFCKIVTTATLTNERERK